MCRDLRCRPTRPLLLRQVCLQTWFWFLGRSLMGRNCCFGFRAYLLHGTLWYGFGLSVRTTTMLTEYHFKIRGWQDIKIYISGKGCELYVHISMNISSWKEVYTLDINQKLVGLCSPWNSCNIEIYIIFYFYRNKMHTLWKRERLSIFKLWEVIP